MMSQKYFNAIGLLLLCILRTSAVPAQTINVSEDFTGTGTANTWFYLNGACLTASTSAPSGSPGTPPGCTAIGSSYYGENLVGGFNGVAGSGQTLPDSTGNGALRFTNGCTNGSNCNSNGGHNQNGAIISGNSYSSSAGIQITFKTATYRGDSQGTANDGADGMSFFLIDGSVTPNSGSYGGSLGYTCSNQNPDYHGMVGAYVGLGIDEFGNFLNGSSNTLGETGSSSTNSGAGDNTASGGLYMPNRIGMRGAGSIAWPWLLSNYATYYGSSTYTNSTSNQQAAVRNTCKNGYLSDFNGNSVSATKINVLDYPAIPNAYKVLSGVTIANEYANGGYARPNGTPNSGSLLMYKLKITADGFLSLSYSVNGGSWLGVLANQSITASNGPLPSTIRFGFAGSTGGSSNIHEVLCFKAASLDTSSSSAATNLKQSAKVTSSSQAYFAFYDPNDWTGRLTANALNVDSSGNLTIASSANWDASCVLTGVSSGSTCTTTGAAGPTAAEGPTSRVILSWNGSAGVPFEWNGTTSSTTLTSAQQAALDAGDSTQTAKRLNFLRGDRTNEVTTSGSGLFRDRDSVLGDIVDSSPTAVGQPVSPYAVTWLDKLTPATLMPENASGAQTYAQFITAEATRENVVYAGANDGFLHGFEAGAFNSSNTFVSATNDGKEVLAYMPAAVVKSIHNSSTVELDYANTQYGHNFYVDAPPATGDLFYGNAWHTWLVGGLGAGGAAIYALDITTPSNFSESNASTLVVGEWSAANITCPTDTSTNKCAASLGNTYGTPVIRRLHNGMWAVIFGNGFGSSSGDAGIFVMTIDPSTAAKTFYYLSTGESGTGDGIAYVTPKDLDGDNVTDYVYAGDLLGNVWRFDLTSSTAGSWAASSAPLFAAGSGHPITSALLVVVAQRGPGFQVMVGFGTGQQTQLTNTTPTTYASGTQSIYAFWDWNLANWNSKSNVQYLSLASASTITPSNLTTQTLTANTSASTVDISSSTICWTGSSSCSSGNNKFGWTAALPGSSEQIIFNPELVGTAFFVNSVIPVSNSVLACTSGLNTGYTYAIAMVTGSAIPGFFVNTTDTSAVGTLSNATGTSTIVTTVTPGGSANLSSVAVSTGISSSGGGSVVVVSSSSGGSSSSSGGSSSGSSSSSGGSSGGSSSSSGGSSSGSIGGSSAFPNAPAGCSSNSKTWGVSQTTSGTPAATQIKPVCPISGQRVTWTHLR